ncbi:MAG: alpha/beta hydrolase [Candidatus Melainabacteria bacterium]|nr:MAG: alpha/beta hydrolase [Candidatus Melainabacteria bacterium]
MKACVLLLGLLFIGAAAVAQDLPLPPCQPATGPGGAAASHAKVVARKYDQGDAEYWLFEPASPSPISAPVVIFTHGWSGMNPKIYQAWIEHITCRGNIVIFPRYQADLKTKPTNFTRNAILAVKNALNRLQTESGHVRPNLEMLAVVGHSAGGQIAAGIAALAKSYGLPPVKAVMCVQPGKSWGPKRLQIPLDDLSKLPANTLLVTVAGDRDTIARDIDAKRIIRESVKVSSQNKNFVMLVSDDHGAPPLIANHFCPTAPELKGGQPQTSNTSSPRLPAAEPGHPFAVLLRKRIRQRFLEVNAEQAGKAAGSERQFHGVDAMDYYGLWKLFDALEDAAFYGRNRQYALGNTPEQRFMGKWSDGVAVKELIIQ